MLYIYIVALSLHTNIWDWLESYSQGFLWKVAVSKLPWPLDGKHIYIQPPGLSESIFHNYKGHFSVVLMAVVYANYKFVCENVGSQGSLSGGGLFAHLNLRRAMDGGHVKVPPPAPVPNSNTVMPHMFVEADAFSLCLDLQKPYSHRELDHDQKVCRYWLSRPRRVVENGFGILPNRVFPNHNLPRSRKGG